MANSAQLGAQSQASAAPHPRPAVLWLQAITLAWMLVELSVAAYSAVTAHSPALLAFASDSLVELLSAAVVLSQWLPAIAVPERQAARASAALLFALAFIVAAIAVASLAFRRQPVTSCSGMAITIAALLAMPVLTALKRREARRSGNQALAADAVQSATCAYLALITLAGLALNYAFHLAWFDSLAALAAIPLLLFEARSAWRGQSCACC